MTDAGDAKPSQGRPWNRWATLGLAVLALIAGQFAAIAALTRVYGVPLTDIPNLSGDGVGVAVIILVSTPIEVVLLYLMSMHTGDSPARYLGLVLPRRSDVVVGILATIAFIAIGDAVSWLSGQRIVTTFQSDIVRTATAAGWLPLLWLAVVVVAPIGEEMLFRGFLFRGWYHGPRDAWLAIGVTAAIFAAIHLQYDFFYIAQIFVSGLLLGWFRWVSGSTLLTMLMHALVNFEGMLETLLVHHG